MLALFFSVGISSIFFCGLFQGLGQGLNDLPAFLCLNNKNVYKKKVWNCNICFDNGFGKSKMKRKA